MENALGRKGMPQPGDVLRFTFPRRDLRVTVDGVPIRPALALGSWAAFKRVSGGHTMVMGDLVLLDSEIAAGARLGALCHLDLTAAIGIRTAVPLSLL
ncbi:MAG: DUF1259 domain-containing protein [Gemmatimonadaceae bacterium]